MVVTVNNAEKGKVLSVGGENEKILISIREGDIRRILRARDLKRRIEELENQILILEAEKRELEQQYDKLGIVVEDGGEE